MGLCQRKTLILIAFQSVSFFPDECLSQAQRCKVQNNIVLKDQSMYKTFNCLQVDFGGF